MPIMTELKVRKIDFQFTDDIPFQWNPGNPHWGNFINFAAFVAPAFERYFIKATRLAMPQISDAAIAQNADQFCLQEAQHSKHHMAHLNMLTKKIPALAQVGEDIKKSYADLLANNSTEFHLAYAAIVELCFGPFAKFVVNNRDTLFVDTDQTVASFFLWHMVEEFEHRNSAIDIYNDVVGSYWYRLKTVPKVIQHLSSINTMIETAFQQHTEQQQGEVALWETAQFMNNTPLKSRLTILYELSCTLLPYHKPDNLQQPEWVSQWFADEEAGIDMSAYYP
jgi:predicted metal-dependent hydrolase